MRNTSLTRLLLAAMMALSLAPLAACSSGSDDAAGTGGPSGSQQAASLETIELRWGDYTMGVDLVSDDLDRVATGGQDYEGRPLKICFFYIRDLNEKGGFVFDSMFDDLKEYPIYLVDKDGNRYDHEMSISEFVVSIEGQGLQAAPLQTRFAIIFDLPDELAIEDLTLAIEGGQEVGLKPYISEAYAADHD